MLKVKVNNKEVQVEEGLTVLQACEKAGAEIPRSRPTPPKNRAQVAPRGGHDGPKN